MFFHINQTNGLPVYEQIARQIMFAIAAGGIPTGDLIPSVRHLSRELAVNPNTVARAYRQLQDQGVLETVRGEGLLVTDQAVEHCRQARQHLMSERILAVLEEARQSQLSDREIKSLIQEGLTASRQSVIDQSTQPEAE